MSSLLESLPFLTATVEAGSFAGAARRLGVTPSAVSRRVAQLEAELGVQLLARTTRRLRTTQDGQAFYEHCVRILTRLEEARQQLARTSASPSGVLRVDAPVALGRAILAPRLPLFLRRYPDVRLELSLHDRFVDPVTEGLDLLVRIGRLLDSGLMARRLGESRVIHCASPDYLRRRGVPSTPGELAQHDCLGYLRDFRVTPFVFAAGENVREVEIAGPCHTNDSEVLRKLAQAGQGIAAVFDFVVRDLLHSGELVTVLDDHPSSSWPIHALYLPNRHLLPKVRVFIDFLAEEVFSLPYSSVGAAGR
jgi:LysR family transcriptional regulator for bpeEF and oprC